MELASPDLASRRDGNLAQIEKLRWQASAGAFDSEQRNQWQVLQKQLATAEAERASIAADSARYAPLAPFDGILQDIDPDLKPGQWVSRQEPLAHLVSESGETVVAYLDEEDVGRITVGDSARFYADGLEGPFLPLEVSRIDLDASRTLPEAALANLYGGSLQVRERKGLLYPEQAVYRVTLKATDPAGNLAGRVWRGKVVIAGGWVAPGWRFLRSALTLFWREAGF